MAVSRVKGKHAPVEEADLVAQLGAFGEPLLDLDSGGFALPFARLGDADVVLLGEATHGTSEFYRARSAITKLLIEQHGFNIVAVEADWPDAARVDRFVRHVLPEPSEEEAFARFPTWMWRNEEVREFVEWLRAYNETLKPEQRSEFRGLDIYSLGQSISLVLRYLDRVDPAAASRARERYGCLTPWQADPAGYGAHALLTDRTCEDEAVTQLSELLAKRLEYAARDGGTFFDAEQNARIVRSAEQYYRIMYRGSAESWNLRDRHMFETLLRLMELRPDAKAVVWAHNSHIGNAAATAMGWSGEFNIGELVRRTFEDRAALIGFGTDRGSVAAAHDWGEPMDVMSVVPAREGSYEHCFLDAGIPSSLTDWRRHNRPDLRAALSGARLERAIGVVYRPETELQSHYFRAVLAEQFDAFVWFETTSAVTPIDLPAPRGTVETYPFGL